MFHDPSTWERKTHLKLWKCVFTSTQTFKTITAFSVPKFVVGPSCHWCRFLYFVGVVCRSSTIHSSHVPVSRPCRLSEFTPNRVSTPSVIYYWKDPRQCGISLCIAISQLIIPGLITVVGVESAVKYSFVLKGMQTKGRKGQYNAELTLSPRLCVKPLITAITAILAI